MKYIYLIIFGVFMIGCSTEDIGFDEDLDLNTEFPESLFEFQFGYEARLDNAPVLEGDVLYPTPEEEFAFKAFTATSEVDNNNGIRYVDCELRQGSHMLRDTSNSEGEDVWTETATLMIRLNVSVTGDDIEGTPFMKSQLLDFLQEDKFYTTKDTLGGITLRYKTFSVNSETNEVESHFVGIDNFGNIGESDYSLKVVSVEEYEDLTREGDLIKKALRVTVEFEGVIGSSSAPEVFGVFDTDQWNIEGGRATFLLDYQQ